MITRLQAKLHQLRNGGPEAATNRRNAAYGGVDFVARALILVIATPIYLKILGAEKFGIWVIITTMLGFGGMFSFGMGPATLKFVSKYRALGQLERVASTIRATWAIYLIFGFLGTLVIATLSPVLIQSLLEVDVANEALAIEALMVASGGLIIVFTGAVFDSALKGYERYDYAVNVNVVVGLVSNIGRVIVLLAGYDLLALVTVTIVSEALGAWVKRHFLIHRLLPDHTVYPSLAGANFRELVGFSFFSWLLNVLGLIRNNGDRLIIGSILGTAALAYYEISVRILTQVYNLTQKVFGYLFPSSSRQFEAGEMGQLRRSYDQASERISILSTTMITPLFALAYPIMQWWMGAEVAAHTALIMQVMAVRFALFPISIVNTYFLLGAGKLKGFAGAMALTTVFMLSVIAILSERYGLMGAALGQCCVVFVVIFNRILVEKLVFGYTTLLPHVLPISIPVFPILLVSFIPLPEIDSVVDLILVFIGVMISSLVVTTFLFKIGNHLWSAHNNTKGLLFAQN